MNQVSFKFYKNKKLAQKQQNISLVGAGVSLKRGEDSIIILLLALNAIQTVFLNVAHHRVRQQVADTLSSA